MALSSKNNWAIVLLACVQFTCSAQLIQKVFAEKVNSNFIYEYRKDEKELWTEFILKLDPDSTNKVVIVVSGARDVRNFILYLECHIKSCFKDEQPLFLPNVPKLIFDKESRAYRSEDGTFWFKRRSLLRFLKILNKEAKKMAVMDIEYKRKKYFF